MGRNASHGEPRRMSGPDVAGPSPFEARSAALRAAERAPQGDGDEFGLASWIFEIFKEDTPSQPRGAIRPSFACVFAPLKAKRAQGRPGASSHPRSAARKCTRRKNRTAAYRCGQSLGLPCAVVGRLMPCSPGSRTFLLASLAVRIGDAVRPVGLAHIFERLDRSNDGQDHTVLPYARPAMSPQFFQPSRRSRKLTGETKPNSAARRHERCGQGGVSP